MSDRALLLMVVMIGVAAASLVVAVEVWALTPTSAERRLCDREVAILLDSHDLVEVQRAGILVHEISCDVARRLPAHAP